MLIKKFASEDALVCLIILLVKVSWRDGEVLGGEKRWGEEKESERGLHCCGTERCH
jgi:hypothetical protein